VLRVAESTAGWRLFARKAKLGKAKKGLPQWLYPYKEEVAMDAAAGAASVAERNLMETVASRYSNEVLGWFKL
jgi:hypothetical protein